ncbi:hypothetical protein ABWI17_25250 (plasmid) [Escherichia coli]
MQRILPNQRFHAALNDVIKSIFNRGHLKTLVWEKLFSAVLLVPCVMAFSYPNMLAEMQRYYFLLKLPKSGKGLPNKSIVADLREFIRGWDDFDH